MCLLQDFSANCACLTLLSHKLSLKGLHSHRCETVPVFRRRHVSQLSKSVLLNGPQPLKHLHTVTHAHPHVLSAFKQNFPVQLMGNRAVEWKPQSVCMFFSRQRFLLWVSCRGVVGCCPFQAHCWPFTSMRRENREKNSLRWEDLETSVKQTHR